MICSQTQLCLKSCVVSAQSNSYVCLLENVCDKSGLSAEVCEGSPFMCGFTWFLAGCYSSLPQGGGYVCVYREHIVQHDVMDGVHSSLYSSCYRW